jgi:hypothetical protein
MEPEILLVFFSLLMVRFSLFSHRICCFRCFRCLFGPGSASLGCCDGLAFRCFSLDSVSFVVFFGPDSASLGCCEDCCCISLLRFGFRWFFISFMVFVVLVVFVRSWPSQASLGCCEDFYCISLSRFGFSLFSH